MGYFPILQLIQFQSLSVNAIQDRGLRSKSLMSFSQQKLTKFFLASNFLNGLEFVS